MQHSTAVSNSRRRLQCFLWLLLLQPTLPEEGPTCTAIDRAHRGSRLRNRLQSCKAHGRRGRLPSQGTTDLGPSPLAGFEELLRSDQPGLAQRRGSWTNS